MGEKRLSWNVKGCSVAKTLLLLHALLFMYSFSGVFSKNAVIFGFPTWQFFVLYGLMLLVLFVYAIGWQQVIKRLPLTLAFANKAVTVVWGIVWGVIFFGETVNIGMIVGAVIVILGVVIYSTDRETENGSEPK